MMSGMTHRDKYRNVGKVSEMHPAPGTPNIDAIGGIEVIKQENKHYPPRYPILK